MILQRYSLHSHHTSPFCRSRRLAPASLPGCCCRAAAVSVRCQARQQKAKKGSKAGPSRSGFGKRKGFGGKPQEDWEAQLLPPYRVYYKQGYKPPRFQGTLKPTIFEGTPVEARVELTCPCSSCKGKLGKCMAGVTGWSGLWASACLATARLACSLAIEYRLVASLATGQAQQTIAVATAAAKLRQASLCFV